MLTNYFRKKIIESIIKEATDKLPELKNLALLYWEQHKDEIMEKVKEEVIKYIKNQLNGC